MTAQTADASEGLELLRRAQAIHIKARDAFDKRLKQFLKLEAWDAFYAAKGRVKTPDDIVDKVLRKRSLEKKLSYEPEDLDDAVACRIVSLFREDMLRAFQLFLDALHQRDPFRTSPFVKTQAKEIIFYTSEKEDADPQMLCQSVRDIVANNGFDQVFKGPISLPTEYSSIHIVPWCQSSDGWNDLGVPVEFQFRTVYEDAWGEINHKLVYESQRVKPLTERGIHNLRWGPHLNALKTFADGCARYSDLILSLKSSEEGDGIYEAMDKKHIGGGDEIFDRVKDLPVPVRNKLRELCLERDAALEREGEERRRLLVSTAAKFADFLQSHEGILEKESDDAMALRYYGLMERAFCLLKAGGIDHLREAVEVYGEVLRRWPTNTIALYRLGQTYHELRDVDKAIEHLESAARDLKSDPFLPKDHNWPARVARNLGWMYWTKSREVGKVQDMGEQLHYIAVAYEKTKPILSMEKVDVEHEVKALNNLTCYAVEYLEISKDREDKELTLDDLQSHLTELEGKLSSMPGIQQSWSVADHVYMLDTRSRAYVLLQRFQKAVETAHCVEQLLGSKAADAYAKPLEALTYAELSSCLAEGELDSLHRALFVIRRYGSEA